MSDERRIEYAWLQISDLHIFDNTKWKQMQNAYENIPSIDSVKFVVVSGDLHQFKTDYQKALDFLNNLRNFLNIPKKHFYIVPGNHDAGDCDSKKAFTYTIEHMVDEDEDVYREYFEDGKLRDCFSAYREFITSFYDDPNVYNKPEDISHKIWNNKLNIIHLNTAINCNGNNELKQIIDVYELSNLQRDILNSGLPSIIIGHHPFRMLHDSHQNTLKRFITDWGVSAYLAGDLHKGEVEQIKTYKDANSNIPCFVCAKCAPDYADKYSDLGCILYVKYLDSAEITVIPYLWNDDQKRFDPSPMFNTDQGYYTFPLLRQIEKNEKKRLAQELVLDIGESIWLPDAEDAKGTQARFGICTETDTIREFLKDDSGCWGISAVKGIGKTYVLQVKRRRMSQNRSKLCVPLGVKPSAANGWGTDSVRFENRYDLSLLRDHENMKNLWKYSIIVYAINQLLNYEEYQGSRTEKFGTHVSKGLHDKLKEFERDSRLHSETVTFCKNTEYFNLDLIMRAVITTDGWTKIASYDLNVLPLLQRRIRDSLELLGKENIVIMIDKVDQAVRETSSERPVPCEKCKKGEKWESCNNPKKNDEYCADALCNDSCCFGCERYEAIFSNTNLRLYEDPNKQHIGLWQRMQLGLVHAVFDIKEDFQSLIEVYFTIRQEAYSADTNLFGEHSNKINRIIKGLEYSKKDHEKIFYGCICEQQKELLYDHSLLNENIELAFVGVDSLCHPYAKELSESIFDTIYRHSFDRSRDIQLYGEAITKHIDEIKQLTTQKERGEAVKELIEKRAAKLAFDDQTDNADKTICYYIEKKKMLPNFWAEPANFASFITMFNKNLLFGAEAKKLCKRFNRISSCGKNCMNCEAEHHPFSMLYKLGMLGRIKIGRGYSKSIVQEFKNAENVTYIRHSHVMNIDKDTIYLLHPALTKSIEQQNIKVKHFAGFIIGKDLPAPRHIIQQMNWAFKNDRKKYNEVYFSDVNYNRGHWFEL